MSLIMTLSFEGDPAGVERYAAENPEKMREIVDHAAEHGLIAHRFYGSDGQILVIDEWPDEQSFHDFFSHMGPHIQPIMAAAGVTAEPRPVFWRKLESRDDYGWDA
jgi:quinol monooxygenase YgiN